MEKNRGISQVSKNAFLFERTVQIKPTSLCPLFLHSVGPAHPHSTFSYSGGQTIRQYSYDLNGNMTQRIEGSDTYTFTYDTENRLVTGAKNGVMLASYTYDGDGKRVKVVEGGLTTYYIGDYYEWQEGPTTTAVKYYYAAGQRIAMRQGGVLTWLLGDHLGSATITATENGTLASEQTYTAWGQTRSGSVTTDRQYTGQISEPQLGIYFYNARYYDASIMLWMSPDPVIPGAGEGGNPNVVGCLGATNYSPLTVDYHENQLLEQLNSDNRARLQDPDFKLPPVPRNSIAFDRYAYSLNNPVRYVDPSGHFAIALALTAITPAGWILLGLGLGAAVVIYAVGPENFAESVINLGEQAEEAVSIGLNALLAKKQSKPQKPQGTPLQTGGNTLTEKTRKALGLTIDQAKAAIESLKHWAGKGNNFHGQIWPDGTITDPNTGEEIGNIKDFLP